MRGDQLSELQPFEVLHPADVGEVEVERRHGDRTGLDRGEVGAVLGVVRRVVAVDEVAAARAAWMSNGASPT